jgi:hypothetical protein
MAGHQPGNVAMFFCCHFVSPWLLVALSRKPGEPSLDRHDDRPCEHRDPERPPSGASRREDRDQRQRGQIDAAQELRAYRTYSSPTRANDG